MVLALDIGGTNIRIAEVSGTKIKNKISVENPRNQKHTIQTIISLIEKFPKPKKICISVAGFEKNGVIAGSPNTSLNDAPLKKILEKKFSSKIFIQNDARCATLAELKLGAGKKFSNFVFLILGTGIGGGIVINKKIYFGNGVAGEICDMIIQDNKSFEYLASGSAAERMAEEKGLGKIPGKKLNELANKKDKTALEIYKEIGNYLGIGLSNLAFILDPQAYIFGGGFSEVKHIYPETKKVLAERFPFNPNLKLIHARFGDNAGLMGAALLN